VDWNNKKEEDETQTVAWLPCGVEDSGGAREGIVVDVFAD